MASHDVRSEPTGRQFCIWVSGRLSESLADDLCGTVGSDAAGGATLTGEFVDQSQLYGILDRLRLLGIGVLRFEISEPEVMDQSQPDPPREAGS